MSKLHLAYLNLGSNIEPEKNLPQALTLLTKHGDVVSTSNVWETRSVGADGPNYLNACIGYETPLPAALLKKRIIRPIEDQMGRKRNEDKNTPRIIDIDIILFDDQLIRTKYWELAFVMIPLSELYPHLRYPGKKETAQQKANLLMEEVWIKVRPDVSSRFRRKQT